MKLLKLIGIRTLLVTIALFLAISVGIPVTTNYIQAEKTQIQNESDIFSVFVGHAGDVMQMLAPNGVAYAATPDYIVDGADDNVQAQLAVDALPATGGKVIFFGGNYSFSATVSRAINNVTIEGSGKSTYFAHDGATALFDTGTQHGWIFKDIRTDAGGVDYLTGINTRLFDCQLGTSYYEYKLYPLTFYVDNTDGTDDLDHGWGVDGDAYKTIQYAWNNVPDNYDTQVNIYINAETYNETLVLDGKTAGGGGTGAGIALIGTLSAQATATQDSSVQGTGATQGSITDAGAFGAFDNMLLYSSNNAEYRIIDNDSANTANVCGTWTAPPAGDYTVYNWGTKITGTRSALIRNYQNVQCYNIWFDGSSTDILINNKGAGWFYRCKFAGDVACEVGSSFITQYSLFNVYDSGFIVGAESFAEWFDCKIAYTNTVARYGITVTTNANMYIDAGCVFDGASNTYGNIGIQALRGGMVFFDDMWVASYGYTRIRNWTYGMQATEGAIISGTANNQYSGNSNDEVEAGATFGQID